MRHDKYVLPILSVVVHTCNKMAIWPRLPSVTQACDMMNYVDPYVELCLNQNTAYSNPRNAEHYRHQVINRRYVLLTNDNRFRYGKGLLLTQNTKSTWLKGLAHAELAKKQQLFFAWILYCIMCDYYVALISALVLLKRSKLRITVLV